MPMTLVETIDSHHRSLLRALDNVEVLLAAAAPADELAAAIESVRHSLLAHDFTAGRFLVGPLRRQQLLDVGTLDAFRDELDQLSQDGVRLTSGGLDAGAVTAFVRRARDHIGRKTRALGPAIRSAIAQGRLSPVPRWRIDELYGLQGGAGTHPSEEWLG